MRYVVRVRAHVLAIIERNDKLSLDLALYHILTIFAERLRTVGALIVRCAYSSVTVRNKKTS